MRPITIWWQVLYVCLQLGLLSLEANANDHEYNVLPPADVDRTKLDKSAVELVILHSFAPGEKHPLQLRHVQYHLRHPDKYQLEAWERTEPKPEPHHQHKSQSGPTTAVDDIDYPAVNTDKPLPRQVTDAPEGCRGKCQKKMQRAQRHRQQKIQRAKEVQALKQERSTLRNNDVSAAGKSLEDTNGHDADNSYSRNHIAGTLTAHKQKKLGTPEAVLNTQRQLAEDKAKARAHMEEVRDENICRLPQRRCLRIERETSKTYSPHCTSVYRCAEDSGCCPQRNEICAPKRTHKFERHFNVMNHIDKRISVEKLTLVNHTECHCVERGASLAEGHAIGTGLPDEQQTLPHFECPALFEKILGKDGKWRCDCSSSNDHCNLFKSGSEHFSLNDRKRIRQGLYKTPTCQYGPYIQKHGGCPTQHEQLPSYNALGMS
ncbi:uncharacterized protein Pvf3 isoform X3 [Drosophila virilis]|uniref:Uncharacterized protein, isoform C n=1 Tax=Drosophila virilis TaxID=7244 RepID=A0A0Q9WYQ6_DROVI|nr:uncharacterized protein LOC6635649 isoform X2 [Drosophila virilis]KRF85584.1 uncharacterized protein Dvir_GJ16164, isoform C [Drosophila virilis]